ncbi:MAG TPA: hypothetical protein VF064_15655 [Pyrinomonadaceae bacterium]
MKRLIFNVAATMLSTLTFACPDGDAEPHTPSPTPAPGKYEKAIRNLEEGNDNQVVEEAIRELYAAGTDAFPDLFAHFGDQRKASVKHFGAKALQCAPGVEPCPPYHPTIGEACFDILGGQVEGNWPKGARGYYTLTAGNAKAWWEARRGMSLKELQLEAARSSLAAARKDRAAGKASKDLVKFLEEHLKDVREGRCCPE